MGLQIKLDADYRSLGLPILVNTVRGFPVDGLKGLYLFEDGTNGQAYPNTVSDLSGGAANGTIRNTWGGATKQTYGLQSADPGVAYDVPIDFPTGDWTFATMLEWQGAPSSSNITYLVPLAHKNWVDTSTGNQIQSAATKTGLIVMPRKMQLANNQKSLGVYDHLSQLGASGTAQRQDTAHIVEPSGWEVFVVSFEAATGKIILRIPNRGVVVEQTNPAKINYAAAFTGTMCFGAMQWLAATDAASKLAAQIFYDRLVSEAEVTQIYKALRTLAQSRSLTLAS